MPGFYDENYGWYEIEDQDDIDFYFETQQQSVEKVCVDCGRTVKIKPEYECCNSCAERREAF